MKKRFLSLILCIAMLFSTEVAGFVALAIDSLPDIPVKPDVWVTLDGEVVDDFSIEQNQKVELLANISGIEAPKYQWQILMDAKMGIWVDIYDKTTQKCEVSYALLKGMLDGASVAYLRCAAFGSDGMKYYSDAIAVTVFVANPDLGIETLPPEESLSEEDLIKYYIENGMFSLLADDVSEYRTITIKYLDIKSLESGIETAIYSPYIAKVEKGTPFNQNVISPTFLGFAPYFDTDGNGKIEPDAGDADGSFVIFNETAVNEDIVINLYYKPINVPFAAKYFFQNINDDLYTENVSLYQISNAETGTIIQDELLEFWAGYPEGFDMMYHIPEAVAADGSTVFECYYDRLYYLLHFDNNGGYGVDPIYARYGTPFIVNDPIRYGYAFGGWDLLYDTDNDGVPDKGDGIADPLPATIQATPNGPDGKPTETYYKAIWQAVETTYTVAYWAEDHNGETYFLGSKVVSQYPNGTLVKSNDSVSGIDDLDDHPVCGKDENHTHSDACYAGGAHLEYVHADQNVTVAGDGSTVVNVYYVHKDYTLRFYYARSKETNGVTTYEVVGGTTYPFGTYGGSQNEHTPLYTLLSNVTEWGKVADLPTVKQEYSSRYILGEYSNEYTNGYTYHYLQFTVPYGAYLKDFWPIGIFDEVKIAESHSTSINGSPHGVGSIAGVNDLCKYGNYAYFSAWNGEYKVKYTQDNASRYGGNETIKGCYMYLDEQVIYAEQFEALEEEIIVDGIKSSVVNFLGFWDNGARVGWSKPKKFNYHIRIQSDDINAYFPSEEGISTNYDSQTTDINLSKLNFKVENYQNFETYDDSTVGNQTIPPITGYNYMGRYVVASTEVINGSAMEVYDIYYYYTADTMKLTFFNYNEEEQTITPIAFGTELSQYKDFVPSYPQKLEENAYEFAGWYTTAGCLPGSEFDFENETMPPNDLVLYAKWAPTTHNVKFFLTLDDMNAYLEDNTLEPLYTYNDIIHGNIVGSVTTPTRTGDGDQPLTFAGWFYIENGQKKAFSPLNMPINSDMTIYADWGSHTPVPYRIQYVLMSDKSVKVAPDSYGHAYAGSTRTFQAKAGPPLNQLYPEYASGYFPTVASHSITMQYESDDMNPEKNVYTFFYVQASEISYTINYVNKENNVVMDSVIKKTTDSVVTERFKAFDNMVPDAFYKRLVISVVWDEESGQYVGLPEDNVINFYYTPNKTTTFYAVKFMLEKLDQPGEYEESTTHIEGVADIGSIIPITPQEFPGFELNNDKTRLENGDIIKEFSDGKYHIEATKEGTELIIYYDRLTVDYTVHYYKYNTTESLLDSKSGSAKYGATITENALSKPGWTCVSATTQSKQISNDASQNVIIFYYAEVQYVVEYIPVQSGMGWLSSTKEVVMGDDKFKGSIARSNEYYSFEGWFMDEACTIPVTPDKATLTSDGDDVNNVLVPVRSGLSETEANKFYAKFSPKAADLTINVTNAADDSQVFVFMIENNATGDTLVVTVVGNGTVTISGLTLAEYTLYQLSKEWSWRYVEYNNVIAHASAGGTVVNVGEQLKSNQQWLNGNSNLLPNKKGE
ncbi:MAG: InlB B-repeat-containing protein [Clostridia bacterium]|nr:InlB B-repeat-containing protein [Clostridia bacterium]